MLMSFVIGGICNAFPYVECRCADVSYQLRDNLSTFEYIVGTARTYLKRKFCSLRMNKSRA